MKPGDRVIATRDIGWRVKKGTRGVVVEIRRWNGHPRVAFTLSAGLVTDERIVTVEVDTKSIAPI